MQERVLTKDELRMRYNELIENPVARVPICICISAGEELKGTNMYNLNEGLKNLLTSLRENEDTVDAAEICIIVSHYGDGYIMSDYTTTDNIEFTEIEAGGESNIAEAISTAINKLDVRVLEYKETGTDYFQPWLITICGGPQKEDLSSVAAVVQQKILERRINSIPVAIDADAREYLKCLGENGKVYALDALKYDEFFKWVGKSAESMSESLSGALKTEFKTDSWEKFF